MRLIAWWQNLKWIDHRYDTPKEPGSLVRKKPLTWKELFFRDRVAVLSNFLPAVAAAIFIIFKIIQLFRGGVTCG